MASADLRYHGQSFEIETPIDLAWIEAGDVARIRDAFHREHERIYGHADREARVDAVALRMIVVGESAKPSLPVQERREGRAAPQAEIEVLLDGAPRRVALHRRAELVHGTTFDGPCVIAQDDTTTIVPDGYAGAVDRFGNLILTRGS